MKTTIFILGSNNFWYATVEVTYQTEEELERHIVDTISKVRNGLVNGMYENNDVEELHVVVGSFKHTNLSTK